MKEISLKKFIAHFGNDIRADKRFCFILGSGASKSSGIPTGDEFVKQWVHEMETIDKADFDKWVVENKVDKKDYASHYSSIFDKRFELSKKDGFTFLEQQMENIDPSCGYAVLSHILAKGQHDILITTNFDSLTEDALFIYTQKKPLVVGHSSLAGYISANLSRPLVVKIHHDLFLSPKNSAEEVNELDDNFGKNLEGIFKNYTPLIIGYGGNDGSLMNFLEGLTTLDEGLFWFYMEGTTLKENIKELVEKANGFFVPINGFDELMLQLGGELEIDSLDTKIADVAEKRVEKYRAQVEKININESKTTDEETLKAIDKITVQEKETWWTYYLQIQREEDIVKKEEIYLNGIKAFPESHDLQGSYAAFLMKTKQDYDEAEKFYKKALKLDPESSIDNGNYAILLHEIRKDYDEAEKFYKKALKFGSKGTNTHGNYAVFLKNIRKDYDGAEKHYKKALELDSENANTIGNYAVFLNDIKDNNEAEKYYKKALELDSEHANNNGNYAKFLIEIQRKDKAISFIDKAFKLNKPNQNELTLELWIYRFAIYYKKYSKNKKDIKKLLDSGICSKGINFDKILEIAKEDKHPEYELLVEFINLATRI